MTYLPALLLGAFVLNLGTAFGAGLYEARIIIPRWFPKSASTGFGIDTDAMQQLDAGRKFWAFVTTGPLTLLTLANLMLVWLSPSPAHTWWLAAVLVTLLERIGTFTFFIPTIIRLQQSNQASSRLIPRWVGLNYARNALTLLAWVLALRALSLV